jgi:hypothetical protein
MSANSDARDGLSDVRLWLETRELQTLDERATKLSQT